MTLGKNQIPFRLSDVLEQYGTCIELIPVDKYFHDVSISLYLKDKNDL